MILRIGFRTAFFKALMFGVLIIILLSGCSGETATPAATLPPDLPAQAVKTSTPGPTSTATGSPTPRPTLRPSATLIPTATSLPSFTPIPTATMTLPPTPFPVLAAAQPYLVYYSAPGGKPSVVLLNANSAGRQVLAMPDGSQMPRLPQALSPDGRWLAFYTGAAGDPEKGPASAGPFDLALHLMHLPDGKVTTVAPLLAKDYPQGLRKLAADIAAKDPSKGLKEADVYNQVWSSFYAGITQAAWSLDGRLLAFAGEMNGSGSNIYLYSPSTGNLKQATEGSQQIQWMMWSPDSKYILYSSSNQQCSGDCASRYAYDLASGGSTALTNMVAHNGSLIVNDWSGPHSLTYSTYINGQGASFLAEINLASGESKDLYANAFNDFAFDPTNRLVALTLSKDIVTQKNMQPGLYLYHVDGGSLGFVASSGSTPDFSAVYWGQPEYPFLIWDTEKVYGLTGDGKLAVISENSLKTVAANGQWVAVLDAKANPQALKLINAQKQVAATVSARYAGGRLFSNPDSSGIFSVYEKSLYYLDIKTGVWKQVDTDLPDPPDWTRRPLLFGWKQ